MSPTLTRLQVPKWAFYQGAVRHARKIRNRYTFLDFAADAGTLDTLIARVA